MKHAIMLLIVFSIVTLLKIPAIAEQKGLIETVARGCLTELEKYCKDVTPGEGRVLACLYAYEDKLSGKCEYTLYDASAQLQRSVTTLNNVANACSNDLRMYCSSAKQDDGRLMICLNKHQKNVSTRCKQALKDAGREK